MPDYINSSDNKEAGKRASKATTNRIHKEFNNHFSHCFMVYALWKPLKEEQEWLQKQQIIAQLGISETSKW